jgi:hypothetical protein
MDPTLEVFRWKQQWPQYKIYWEHGPGQSYLPFVKRRGQGSMATEPNRAPPVRVQPELQVLETQAFPSSSGVKQFLLRLQAQWRCELLLSCFPKNVGRQERPQQIVDHNEGEKQHSLQIGMRIFPVLMNTRANLHAMGSVLQNRNGSGACG